MTTTTQTDISLAESYAWCQSLAKRRAGNFYYSFLTLPRDRFRDMCVLYAYMRVCDDLGDNFSIPLADRAARLVDWREQLTAALAQERFEHPGLPALAKIVKRYGIPSAYLFDVIDGIEADLQARRFETFDELQDYCYHVAGAVGLCCLHIWGFSDPRARDCAIACGTAFQLTNILRDLGEDAAIGRVYLPTCDLEQFEYTPDDIAAHCRDDRFRRLMQFEVARAKEFYGRAGELFEYLERPGRAIYAAMLQIYGGLLNEIERRDYDVYSRRVSLPKWRKLSIVAKAVLRQRSAR